MILRDLKIHHVRNIDSTHLLLNPRFTFLIGANGSGKTSLLEALYLLSCGHSFRCREVSSIISHGQASLIVFADSQDQSTLSIQKSCIEPTLIKINNQFCKTTSQLAYALPCQVFFSELFQIVDAGPSVRRTILDWGLFHVEPNYLLLWKEYKQLLKQRNALLKIHSPYAHFIPWDQQLNEIAHQLDALRKAYFEQWQSKFYNILEQLTDCSCCIHYYKGWDKKQAGKSLLQSLAENFQSDNQKLYTQYGAHQADILIESQDKKAKQILSRGQQKIILIALKLAQSELLEQDCLYLFDDLPAELDEQHQKKLFHYLSNKKGQYLITSLNEIEFMSQLPKEEVSLYRMENGLAVKKQ